MTISPRRAQATNLCAEPEGRLVPWVGFDFDGTIATHDHGSMALGQPIAPTVQLLAQYLAAGYLVKILTARAADPYQVELVKAWCLEHIGLVLPVTDRKDYAMLLLYDDRAIAVEPNTGRLLGWRTCE